MLEFAYGNFLLNTISSINFTKKIKSMGFSMTVIAGREVEVQNLFFKAFIRIFP